MQRHEPCNASGITGAGARWAPRGHPLELLKAHLWRDPSTRCALWDRPSCRSACLPRLHCLPTKPDLQTHLPVTSHCGVPEPTGLQPHDTQNCFSGSHHILGFISQQRNKTKTERSYIIQQIKADDRTSHRMATLISEKRLLLHTSLYH